MQNRTIAKCAANAARILTETKTRTTYSFVENEDDATPWAVVEVIPFNGYSAFVPLFADYSDGDPTRWGQRHKIGNDWNLREVAGVVVERSRRMIQENARLEV